jgi:hypothetical protein
MPSRHLNRLGTTYERGPTFRCGTVNAKLLSTIAHPKAWAVFRSESEAIDLNLLKKIGCEQLVNNKKYVVLATTASFS